MYCSGQLDTLASRSLKAFILGSGNTSNVVSSSPCDGAAMAAAAAAAAGWTVAGAFVAAAVGCLLVDTAPEII